MKSMSQMQDEMLAKAHFDGTFPRPVVFFPGILALAHNEEQWEMFMELEKLLIWGHILILAATLIITGVVLYFVR